MAEEIFRTIPDFEDYQVSNRGRVISNKSGRSTFLKPQRDALGYLHVRLFPKDEIFGRYPDGRGKKPKLEKVHRLVALLFVPKPDNQDIWEVNHKDGNKENNVVTNLEWITRGDNIRHSWKIGLRVNSAEKAALSRHKPVKMVTSSGEVIYYKSRVHCALDIEVGPSRIFYFINRSKPVARGPFKGYRFFDAPEVVDDSLFITIANAEEKLLKYKQTYNEYYKNRARQRRALKLKKQNND